MATATTDLTAAQAADVINFFYPTSPITAAEITTDLELFAEKLYSEAVEMSGVKDLVPRNPYMFSPLTAARELLAVFFRRAHHQLLGARIYVSVRDAVALKWRSEYLILKSVRFD